MGFFNSFKSQIGRDTGKVVSNAIWGDKHASVYRRAQSRNAEKKQEKESQDFQLLLQQQKIDKAQNTVDKGVSKVISMKIPQKKELIIEMLEELTVMLIANPWGSISKEEFKITNNYSDAILTKYEHALLSLKAKFPKASEIAYFENQYLGFNKKKRLKKYSETVLYTILGVVLFSIVGVMAYNENAEKTGDPTFFESIGSIFD